MPSVTESESANWSATKVPWTATAIAAAVRGRRIHPRRVVEESLRRIAARDSSIGAFQVVRTEAARSEADSVASRDDLAQLPLAGVPIAIKDNVRVAGEPMRMGSRATNDEPQADDHEVVRRLRGAGAIIVGITRMPEFGLYGATDSHYGITRNPWNLGRTPGGSSGGAGAAVAAGMVPLAHGNDGLGSVRIPAACCGLVGIKPGKGVVPSDLGETNWYGLAENGILASTTDDAALGMSVIADQPALMDPQLPQQRLVVAVSMKSPLMGVHNESAYVRATNSVATLLARAGHEVRSADPDYPNSAAVAALAAWFAAASDEMRQVSNPRLTERRVRTHARIGRMVRRTSLLDPHRRDRFIDSAKQFLQAYDLLVTPALAQPPIEARLWSSHSWASTMLGTVRWTPYAAPWNVAGFPAIVVPTGNVHPRTKTPLAVQLVARPGREDLLLAVSGQVQRMRPWPGVAPAYR